MHIYGEYTSRVYQKVLINHVHSDHWLVADNVERNQPGVSTILSILKKDFAHFGGNNLAGGLLNCVL